MPTFLLMRLKPLTTEEIRKLPPECEVITDSNTVVARADIPKGPLSIMLKLAVAMGRAVPDADFACHEVMLPGAKKRISRSPANSTTERVASAAMDSEEDIVDVDDVDSEEEIDSIEEDKTWWDLLEDGQSEEALEALSKVQSLSPDERMRIRSYLNSPEDAYVAFVCRAVRKMKWNSYIVSLRKAFHHKSPEVRYEAVTSVGALAGPSMSPAVHLLMADPDEKVQAAAKKAYRKLRR